MKKYRWIILALAAGLITALFLYWVVGVNGNILLNLLVMGSVPILWILMDWSVSKETPDRDDHRQIGDTATVLQDFENVGNYFEGSIKLNGTNWKAMSKTSPYKAGTVVKTISLDNLTYEVEEVESTK